MSLTVACVLWTAIYDTIYAHQDLADDMKLGLKSMAVLLVAPCGCALSLGAMIANVSLKDSGSCWWWFRHGFWSAGWSITIWTGRRVYLGMCLVHRLSYF